MRSIYDPSTYPQGVLNPYGPRVHAWNGDQGTRYHGPIYTRPMATFPGHARPLWSGESLGSIPGQLPQGNNDMSIYGQQVDTRGGLFGSGGYGGGIFDGSMSGAPETTARSLFQRALQPVSGCAPCGAVGAAAAYSFCNEMADDRVKAFQRAMNAIGNRLGYQPIAVDGQLGPATCGMLAKLGQLGPSITDAEWRTLPKDVGSMVLGCDTSTMPTKKGESKPDPLESTITPNTYALPWGVPVPDAQKVQGNLNVELAGHGYAALSVTGSLDAPTCGAMRFAQKEWGLNYLDVYGKNCQSFEDPRLLPPEQRPPKVKDPGKMMSMVALGLVGAAAIGGAVFFAKKKKR